MKSGMMLAIVMLCSTLVEARDESLRSMINLVESEQEAVHGKVLELLPESEEVTFYNADWLRLRRRKQWSIAEAEIHLKPSAEQSEPGKRDVRILAVQ